MTNTNEKPAASKAPSHIAYSVRELSQNRSFWTRIGCAWPHADGKGFAVQLEAVPLDGRLTFRVASESKA